MGLANDFPSTEAKFENEACTYQDKEAKHSSVEISSKKSSMDSTSDDIQQLEEKTYQDRVSKRTRAILFIVAIIVLIIGRNGVPDVESANVQDKVLEALQVVNDFINKSGNEIYRDVMQMFCSFFVDVTFITTFGYWVLRGKGIRLPISMLVFYIVRALVQQVWVSPFPQGYYWDAPLIPSLVVPYGRGSDFFFSGHSGFLVICASEWHKIKMPKMRNFSICVAIYTIFILLTYRIHYSIDIFTGVIFAEWCFGKVDLHEEKIINFFASFKNIGKLFGAKNNKIVGEVLPL